MPGGGWLVLPGGSAAELDNKLNSLQNGSGISHPQTKTWLLIGVIFAAVSTWLFLQG